MICLFFFSFFPIDLWLPKCTIRGSYTIKSPNLPNEYSWGATLWRINSEKTIWHTGSTQKHRDSCVSYSRRPPSPVPPPFFFLFIFQNSLLHVTFLKYLNTSFGILSIKDTVKCLVQLHQRWLHSCTVQEHWLEERWRMYPEQYPFSHNYLSFFPCWKSCGKMQNVDIYKDLLMGSSQVSGRRDILHILRFFLGLHNWSFGWVLEKV